MPLLLLATIEVVDLFVGLTVLRANSEEGCITSALLCASWHKPTPTLRGVDQKDVEI